MGEVAFVLFIAVVALTLVNAVFTMIVVKSHTETMKNLLQAKLKEK